MKTGSCLCGGVTFEMRGPLRARHGLPLHTMPQADGQLLGFDDRALMRTCTSPARIHWPGTGPPTWRSADSARLAAPPCSGKADGRDTHLNLRRVHRRATGLKLEGHIFCDNAGDYYEIAGGGYRSGQA